MVAVALQRYLRSRRDEALALVSAAEDGEGRRTVVTGAEACWAQVSRVVPEMLVVEEGYVHPVPPDGRGSSGRHDLVEELMELVIQKGGLVALVDDGDLADRDRVAMVARVGRD
jgi:hypothetical protein